MIDASMAKREVRFELNISAQSYLRYYRGGKRWVQVRDCDGRTIRFPAHVLRPHVTREGIHGEFVLRFDDEHRFISIDRIGD